MAPEPAATYADAAHFQSALLNLVINARDATAAAGQIVISTRNATLGESDRILDNDTGEGRAVVVCVRDNGAGMAPDIAAKAFDPFFTTKETGKGTGLGLSQVQGFARQSGGYAAIESQPGHGAAISIYLPALAPDALSTFNQASHSSPEGR
jgi:signal transduction histidine kinase